MIKLSKTDYLWLVLAIIGLILVRFFENILFCDPFLVFFKQEFQNKPLPNFKFSNLFLSLSFRYFLNSFFSLMIILVLFKNVKYLKVSVVIYLIAFIVFSLAFYYLLNTEKTNHLWLFYMRRFLIQPMLLFLLVAAFFYQNKVKKLTVK